MAQTVVDARSPGEPEDGGENGDADEAIGAETAGEAQCAGRKQGMRGFRAFAPAADPNGDGQIFGDGDRAGGKRHRPEPHAIDVPGQLQLDANDRRERRPKGARRPADRKITKIAVEAQTRSKQGRPYDAQRHATLPKVTKFLTWSVALRHC
ncbi:MAG TPA: hypothetical protein P5256_04215 [Beijerinckiaceae bacterium]|nr:hypothetical protein [Methylobacteriaceae bacterium]MCO5085410.1 hypothetical protein [Methylobacteriaceae bacterium]HRY02305.1 hypothetical protein [Beijerinckiaceae bacterium]